jgi:hypothetical protein
LECSRQIDCWLRVNCTELAQDRGSASADRDHSVTTNNETTGLGSAKKLYSLAPCIGSPNWLTVLRPGTERLWCVRPADDVGCHSTIGARAARLFVYPCRSPYHIVTVCASPRKAGKFIVAISRHIARPPPIWSGWCSADGFLLRVTARGT